MATNMEFISYDKQFIEEFELPPPLMIAPTRSTTEAGDLTHVPQPYCGTAPCSLCPPGLPHCSHTAPTATVTSRMVLCVEPVRIATVPLYETEGVLKTKRPDLKDKIFALVYSVNKIGPNAMPVTEQMYLCNFCQLKKSSISDMNDHIAVHLFKCNVCLRCFASHFELFQHKFKAHDFSHNHELIGYNSYQHVSKSVPPQQVTSTIPSPNPTPALDEQETVPSLACEPAIEGSSPVIKGNNRPQTGTSKGKVSSTASRKKCKKRCIRNLRKKLLSPTGRSSVKSDAYNHQKKIRKKVIMRKRQHNRGGKTSVKSNVFNHQKKITRKVIIKRDLTMIKCAKYCKEGISGGIKYSQCRICGMKQYGRYAGSFDFHCHMAIHSGKSLWECFYCPFQANRPQIVENHWKDQHPTKALILISHLPAKKRLIDTSIESRDTDRKMKGKDSKLWQCPICQRCNTLSVAISRHIQLVHPECPQTNCEQVSKQRSSSVMKEAKVCVIKLEDMGRYPGLQQTSEQMAHSHVQKWIDKNKNRIYRGRCHKGWQGENIDGWDMKGVELSCYFCPQLTGALPEIKHHLITNHIKNTPIAVDIEKRGKRLAAIVRICGLPGCNFATYFIDHYDFHKEVVHRKRGRYDLDEYDTEESEL